MLVAEEPPTEETTVALCEPVTSPESIPLKLVAVPADVAVPAVVAEVAVVAVPLRFAVIVPAEKFPEASRFTMAEAVFAFVAALAATSAE